jgi:hypothetical protein
MYDGEAAIIQRDDAFMTVMEAFTESLLQNDGAETKEKRELCRIQ